jgi:hypothetical protein
MVRHPESTALAADKEVTRTQLPLMPQPNPLQSSHASKPCQIPTLTMPPTITSIRTHTGVDPHSIPISIHSLDGAYTIGVEEGKAAVAALPTEVVAPGAHAFKYTLKT